MDAAEIVIKWYKKKLQQILLKYRALSNLTHEYI